MIGTRPLLGAGLAALALLPVGAGIPLATAAASAPAGSILARGPTDAGAPPCTVQRIIDGDTFVCGNDQRVRLILVNTPEMSDEPLGRLARSFLVDLMPVGTEVRLDLGVQERDRYGRLLAYVHLRDGRMVNQVLAREGYAQVMVVPPNVDGVERIRAAVDSARAEGAGLWGREGFGDEGPPQSGPGSESDAPAGRCHPSYPGVCIPPPPPDLDCPDVEHRRFRVEGSDPHRFDGDGDGVGCEGMRGHASNGPGVPRLPSSPLP